MEAMAPGIGGAVAGGLIVKVKKMFKKKVKDKKEEMKEEEELEVGNRSADEGQMKGGGLLDNDP